ncbi:hypothetical protein LIER_24024 [Lithospermum erythrorhizon]|uniref:Retrotransposon gag domain-containing protein n=1 Tax=Lithospermum erythrorhizon TaxID=34254 RepID=A0AAV3R2T6_LITER
MESNLPGKQGVSTRAADRTTPSSLANPSKNPSNIPRMEPSKGARTDIPVPRITGELENLDVREGGDPIQINKGHRQNSPHQLAPYMGTRNPSLQISDHASDSRRMSKHRRQRDTGKAKVLINHHRPDNESSHSNHAPPRREGRISYLSDDGDSSDSHTRRSINQSGYDLTTSDSTPESSPIRKNQSRRKEKPIRTPERSSIKEYSCHHRDKQPQEDQYHRKPSFQPEPSTRHEARGSSCNAELQKQVDEHRSLLKDITPDRGPVKHSTLLPFSSPLRKAMMPSGFRMPKFKTFSGFGDPGNHLKAFYSHLSFRTSNDEVYARAFLSSLSGQALKWFHKLPPDSIDRWQNIVDLLMDKFGPSIVADDDERTLIDIQ